ncbi:DNA gyrase inhibitor YacG [Zoogloea sp.]|uniref:DNA gyrase inhibitor YacG n=1 Tax=Zoogloea sp. TaxID=49181 RepID=UPI00262A1BA2|nr:DNA gyrase inhibitor YacG [Zoogloea sp.]MDD3353709.1 DNA gyrase inhibitor YacG [Zoogloea sp.]
MSDSSRPRVVKCPTCAAPVVWGSESPWRPFCSDRCRLIDLGAWASDAYRVAGETPLDNDTDPLNRSH